jgi:hypothetical protein
VAQARNLESYKLHRLMKVLFPVMLLAIYAMSWIYVFTPLNYASGWGILYPGDQNYNRTGDDHYVISDEQKTNCPAAFTGAKHCLVHFNEWWPSDDGTGQEMTEVYKFAADRPVTLPQSFAYAAIFTLVVGFLLYWFYCKIVLYVALGKQ